MPRSIFRVLDEAMHSGLVESKIAPMEAAMLRRAFVNSATLAVACWICAPIPQAHEVIHAWKHVADALEPLTIEARRRVVRAMACLLGGAG